MSATNPIVALWSHPRSMSTAMERIMRERGDMVCAHEPFMYDYYVHRKVREMPHFETEDDRPLSYVEIRNWLLEQAKSRPVFFKDMSYYVIPQLFEDDEFLSRLTHTFLIRNPVASILSYYKLDSEVTLEEIGIETQWRHFEGLRDRGFKSVVVEAESIANDPQGVMATYWNAIGLSFVENAFEWGDAKLDDWQQVSGWHQEVLGSSGIRPVAKNDAERKQWQFDEQCKTAPQLAEFLDHHLPFYKKLQNEALA